MNISSNPAMVHKPLGKYCHTTLVPANAKWLVLSGQVGIDKKGNLANGIRKQTEQTPVSYTHLTLPTNREV